ncbi:histamine H2 receptor-like [Stylophora pistillata]|uniref:histamine H2 receptor-like n=1 Tax=Stylophora pistillata TaxID=50429 RepID=UPI000C051EF9|nr:histamine H2 receptor-like [Stylophora pistillata]
MNELCWNGPFQFFPSFDDFKDLRGTFIANCIFNGFLTYTAILLNIITIYVIQKTATLPKTLKTLLTSLAVSDVIIGLVGQPTYISFLASWFKWGDPSCNAYRWLMISATLFSLASFLGVVAISVDRFLAIHLHLRYQELVTRTRVVTLVISIWVFSAFVSLMVLWVSVSIYTAIVAVTIVCGFIVNIVVYIRIFLIVQQHKNQIQSLQVLETSQSGEMTNFAGLIKSTVGVLYVFLVFLVCYLPCTISVVVIMINGPSITLKRFFLCSLTLVYLNSSLNPVIYCWKMRHIRQAIMATMRNISNRRRPSR